MDLTELFYAMVRGRGCNTSRWTMYTFVSLLNVEKFGGGGVLGAFVLLLVGMEYDGECSVAFPYFVLGRSGGQVEHGTVQRSAAKGETW